MKAAVVFFVAALGLPLTAAADLVSPIETVRYFVNIRAEPDAGSDVIARLYRGDSMPLLRSIDEWHEVRIEDGLNGFISAQWTTVLTEAELQVADDGGAEAVSGSGETAPAIVEEADTTAIEVAEPAPAADALVEEAPEAPVEESQAVAQPADTITAAEESAELPLSQEMAVDAESAAIEPDPYGPQGEIGPPGPPGPPGSATLEGSVNFLTKFTKPTVGGSSQVYDDGRNIGIATTDPKQRLEVNGNIQIHERNSNVAGLMITQAAGETGYIMHNRASTLTIGAGSVDRITIDNAGNVGIGASRPSHPLEMASGAHVTAGGVWTNSSSRQDKENIAELTPEEALAALASLEPVRFNYRADASDEYVGFIAEDVPELVASRDRTGLSAMDIVAVLTKVVQAQQARIEALEARLAD